MLLPAGALTCLLFLRALNSLQRGLQMITDVSNRTLCKFVSINVSVGALCPFDSRGDRHVIQAHCVLGVAGVHVVV